LILECSIFVY